MPYEHWLLRCGAERALAHVLVSTDAGLRVAESTGLPASMALIVHFDLPTRKVPHSSCTSLHSLDIC